TTFFFSLRALGEGVGSSPAETRDAVGTTRRRARSATFRRDFVMGPPCRRGETPAGREGYGFLRVGRGVADGAIAAGFSGFSGFSSAAVSRPHTPPPPVGTRSFPGADGSAASVRTSGCGGSPPMRAQLAPPSVERKTPFLHTAASIALPSG